MTGAVVGSSRRTRRGGGAIAAGFMLALVLTLGTDQVLHVLGVYRPWGEPMREPGLNLLALAYRVVYTVAGGWLTARLAPRAPMRHALALGAIGFVLSLAGAIVTIRNYDLGPAWYPIALVLTAVPCCWLGGVLYERRMRVQPRAGR